MNIPTRLIPRIRALRARQSELAQRILDELSQSAPNVMRLRTLERMVGQTNDQIAAARGQLRRNGRPDFPSAA